MFSILNGNRDQDTDRRRHFRFVTSSNASTHATRVKSGLKIENNSEIVADGAEVSTDHHWKVGVLAFKLNCFLRLYGFSNGHIEFT
jgi:hypothetical protein